MLNILKNGMKLMSAYRICPGNRLISSSSVLQANHSNPTEKPQSEHLQQNSIKNVELKRPLTNFDRKVLVWSGKFKSADEIPVNVPHETLDRARDRFRVKVCIYMMIATLIGCIIMIVSGKRAAERGESVSKSNMEWHREYNAAAAAKEANKNK